MKIACIYATDVPHSTGTYVFRALQSLGHQVVPYHHAAIETIPDGFDLHFIVDSTTFYEIPKKFNSLYYAIDTHLDLWNRLKMAKTAKHVAMAQYSAGVALAEIEGIKAHWLPLGCDEEYHGKVECEKEFDVVFVGTLPGHDPWRSTIESKLGDFQNYVGGWSHSDMGQIYSRSKIILNNTYCNNKQDINMRVFEAFCSGSYLLTQRLDNGDMEKLFPGQLYSVFSSDREMIDKIKIILNNWEDCNVVAEEARKYVVDHYTYSKNIEKLLGEI